jgi:hypothetical protein
MPGNPVQCCWLIALIVMLVVLVLLFIYLFLINEVMIIICQFKISLPLTLYTIAPLLLLPMYTFYVFKLFD